MIDLMKEYGTRYKVVPCPCDGEHHGDPKKWQEIAGKRGYIQLWGDDELELYLASTHIAARIERLHKDFKPKNHYDDATAFVFKPEHIAQACKWIQATNRRHLSPEHLEKARAALATINSLRSKARQNGAVANDLPKSAPESQAGVQSLDERVLAGVGAPDRNRKEIP